MQQQQKKSCWSEGTSPKKQVRISEPPEVPDPSMYGEEESEAKARNQMK